MVYVTIFVLGFINSFIQILTCGIATSLKKSRTRNTMFFLHCFFGACICLRVYVYICSETMDNACRRPYRRKANLIGSIVSVRVRRYGYIRYCFDRPIFVKGLTSG